MGLVETNLGSMEEGRRIKKGYN